MYLAQNASTPEQVADLRSSTAMFLKLPESTWDQAARGELWSSSISDPGSDFNQLKLFDTNARQIANERINGY